MAERILESRSLANGGTLGAKREVTFNYCYCLGIFTDEELIEIEETKDHLAYEIHVSVLELDEAMIVAFVAVAFPFQLLASYIFSKLTGRNFVMRSTTYFDLVIFVLVAIWFEKFEEYEHADNRGLGL